MHNGLRDLHDAHRMVGLFAAAEDFWARLESVAAGNDLAGPVSLGLRLLVHLFGTDVPNATLAALSASASPDWAWQRWLPVYEAALLEPATGATSVRAAWARQRIYVRSHALRMPTGLLIRHLLRKAWMRRRASAADSAAAATH